MQRKDSKLEAREALEDIKSGSFAASAVFPEDVWDSGPIEIPDREFVDRETNTDPFGEEVAEIGSILGGNSILVNEEANRKEYAAGKTVRSKSTAALMLVRRRRRRESGSMLLADQFEEGIQRRLSVAKLEDRET